MSKIWLVLFASFVVAVGSAFVPGISPARADWDEDAYVQKTLDSRADDSVGDRFFHVEWSAIPAGDGQVRITGYVYNDYGDDAVDVDLRVNEMDGSGRRVERLVEPVRGSVPAGGRTYFDVRVPASASYQVSVASFDFVEMAN
ncbi:MAG TPA: hypothetical protein VID28_04255 [Methylomirabilota bacterium]|jgi:hypothetical protein